MERHVLLNSASRRRKCNAFVALPVLMRRHAVLKDVKSVRMRQTLYGVWIDSYDTRSDVSTVEEHVRAARTHT
jgi:hypothetical protein